MHHRPRKDRITVTNYLLAMTRKSVTTMALAFGIISACAQPGVRYPYIDTSDTQNGPVIISRDAEGGVGASVLHENWTATPMHVETSPENTVSAKLQVANADLSDEKMLWSDIACPDGWRIPTTMELMLIWTMGGASPDSYDTDVNSPRYNPPVTNTPMYDIPGFTPYKTDTYWGATRVGRSPSSVTTLSMETGMTGGGSTAGPDRNPARCVRDVE